MSTMEMKEWKKRCTVTSDDHSFDGIAHVVQVRYDERFSPWFAAIQLADQEAMFLPNDIEVEFDGGRKAFCHVTSRHNDGSMAYLDGEMETPTAQFYVVGRSALTALSIMTGESKHFFE